MAPPEAKIHAFEIAPDTHKLLAGNLNDSGVANAFGLGAQERTIRVNVTPGNDLVSSALEMSDLRQGPPVECPIRGETPTANSTESIGSTSRRSTWRVPNTWSWTASATCFPRSASFNGRWHGERLLPRPVEGLLRPPARKGLRHRPATPDRVAFKGYDPRDEGFALSNWVAVNRQLWTMLKALA